MTDWRDPALRRELFHRSYTFSLETGTFPGMVYPMLPALADQFDLNEDGRAWLAWLNGNTQNVVTSQLLLEAAPTPWAWQHAVDFWDKNFKMLEWDTDRRHQKSAFGRATEQWVAGLKSRAESPASAWHEAASGHGARCAACCWQEARRQPYLGRISAWSYLEFARILLPFIPDVDGWHLKEPSSRSHRNALCLLSGFDDAWGWDGDLADLPIMLGLLPKLHDEAEQLLKEAKQRNLGHPNVSRLSMESALCTFKSWHKPNRRYPGVYADMMHDRIRKAERRWGRKLDNLWQIRKDTLPRYLRLEDNPYDPGVSPLKQNLFRETGDVLYLHRLFDDMVASDLEQQIANWSLPLRKEPS